MRGGEVLEIYGRRAGKTAAMERARETLEGIGCKTIREGGVVKVYFHDPACGVSSDWSCGMSCACWCHR